MRQTEFVRRCRHWLLETSRFVFPAWNEGVGPDSCMSGNFQLPRTNSGAAARKSTTYFGHLVESVLGRRFMFTGPAADASLSLAGAQWNSAVSGRNAFPPRRPHLTLLTADGDGRLIWCCVQEGGTIRDRENMASFFHVENDETLGSIKWLIQTKNSTYLPLGKHFSIPKM